MMVASPAQASDPTYPSSVSNLTISNAGNWAGGLITFNVTYNGINPGTFDFETADGTALSPLNCAPCAVTGLEDFDRHLNRSGFTFPGTASNGSNTTTVTVQTTDDVDTSDESFQLIATDDNHDTKAATGTIWAAASYPTFTLTAPTTPVAETATTDASGQKVQKKVTVTALLSSVLPHPLTIPLMTVDGSDLNAALNATSAHDDFRDYDPLAPGSAITIPAYSYTGNIDVTLHDDSVYEPPVQSFDVTSATATPGTTGGPVSTEISIKDDDPMPSVSIGDADPVTEGGILHFPVSLSGPSELPVTVLANSATGVRRADSNPAMPVSDYNPLTDIPMPVVIAAYTRSQYFDVVTLPDAPPGSFEGPENVKAVLSGSAQAVPPLLPTLMNATLGTPTSAYGIINDATGGPTPAADTTNDLGNSIPSGFSFSEGASGEVVHKIHVSLGVGSYAVPVKVDYAFKDGTATNGVDYKGSSGSYTFPAGTAVNDGFDIPVTIVGDTIKEGVAGLLPTDPDYETFEVDFTSSTSTITPAQDPIAITEGADDVTPTWSASNVSVTEGDTGTATAKVPVVLSAPAATDTTFSVSLTDGTATSSGTIAGATDYSWPDDRTLTIPAGSTTGYFMIPIASDTVFENDENFTVNPTLTSANISGAVAPGTLQSSVVTIVNDDAKPSIAFNNLTSGEGSTVRVNGTIVGKSQYPYSLGFSVAAGDTDPATPGTDLDAPDLTTTVLNVPRGTDGSLSAATLLGTPFPMEIYLTPDDIDEPTENYTVTAREITPSPTGFTTSVGNYKITDDPADMPPAASIRDETIGEREKSVDVHVDMSFDSTNSATSSTQSVSIPYYTLDGSAKAGEDYTRTVGTLTVPAGTTTATINVPIINDQLNESPEKFYVKLGTPSPAGAAVDKGTGEVTIFSDDTATAPTINVPATEPGSVSVPITGTAAAGSTVELWGAPWGAAASAMTKLLTTTAASNGSYKFARLVSTGYQFQTKANGLTSPVAKVALNQTPLFLVSTSKGKLGLAVQGNPRGPKQSVIVQRLSGGKWVTGWKGTTGTNNLWKLTVSEKSKSSWTLRAYVAGSSAVGVNPGYSGAKKITIK